jgi:beta-galactosidase
MTAIRPREPGDAGPIVPKVPLVLYGGDYNPEQWERGVWREDVRLMQEAGVNLVSLGIFSWAQLEPQPGIYEFGWLDEVMDLLHTHGISVDLATATASPPPWLAARHPESLPVTAQGVTLWPGARQQYCPSSRVYREAAGALVRRLAERYKDHPALALWHINNEYGCHVSSCYCDASAAAFRAWLQQRYGTLAALNKAWGTAFWSQRYDAWDEINPPRAAPTFVNPTQQLDYRRFSCDELLACFEAERAILREVTPHVPVTTNFMGFFKPLDYWTWAAREDIVSNDSYPDPADPHAPLDAAMACDLMRSLGGGRPWLLMEQTPSQVNWRAQNVLKRPGQMRLWSLQAVARGAEGIMFFQWRASHAGAEKFHGAMVPHVGTERSRVWREVRGLGAELGRLDALLGARVPAEVALVLDWESWWALELDSRPSRDVRLMDAVQRYYDPLYRRNIAVDFVAPDANLGRYKVLLVPNLYLVREGVAPNLERFVADGGTLVMSFFSGIVDAHDHILLGGYPAPFRTLLGLRVEEFDPYVPGQTNHIAVADDGTYACDVWSDVIDLEGAQAVALFKDDFYAGRAAVTRHAFGQGAAYYLGSRPDETFMDVLLARVCREAGVRPTLETPAGIEVVRRVRGERSFLFVLNHTRETRDVYVGGQYRDLLTDALHAETISLDPYGVVILDSEPEPAR